MIVTAAGARAFSAGGDLRALYDAGRAGHHQAALTYWRTEYALNALIKRYRKPYVSLIDGIVMGGGVGISIHGSHRVAGAGFEFAMPEVGIGFFPDVGATWFLPRLPGEARSLLCFDRGLARPRRRAGGGYMPIRSGRHGSVTCLTELCGNVPVDALLGAFSEPAPEGPARTGAAHRSAVPRHGEGHLGRA